jgi:hypothetical protein
VWLIFFKVMMSDTFLPSQGEAKETSPVFEATSIPFYLDGCSIIMRSISAIRPPNVSWRVCGVELDGLLVNYVQEAIVVKLADIILRLQSSFPRFT